MGLKSGSFVSRSGKTYIVEFRGDSVKNGDTKFSVPPVTLSMVAGEHKFCGFKSTTATINILTDEPLIDLYASTITAINVNITEDGECIFNGYVMPFAFDQSYTGKADTVTVQAVDALTVRKDIPYENVGTVHGVDKTGREIVQEICKRAGVTKIVQHLNFNDSSDVMKSASPLDVMVAQAGFLQDEVSDCDALSAICKFFGYTGHLIGKTLYLYDEHCLGGITDANIYDWTYANGWTLTKHHRNSASSPLSLQTVGDVHNDISVTIERAYDGIQITPEGSDVSVLLPDVCADENVGDYSGELGSRERTFQDKTADVDYIQYRTPRSSKVMDVGLVVNGNITDDWSSVGGDPVIDNTWSDGAMCLNVSHANRKRYKYYDDNLAAHDIISCDVAQSGNMLWLKGKFVEGLESSKAIVGKQRSSCQYSHTGGSAKITLSCVLMRWGNWIDMTRPDEQSAATGISGELKFIRILCGDKLYYHDAVSPWITDDGGMSRLFTDGNSVSLLPTVQSTSNRTNDVVIPVPNSEPLRVELGWVKQPALIYSTPYGEGWNIYLTSLSIIGFGDDINTECAGLRHSFGGSTNEMIEVSSMLTTRHSDSVGSTGFGMNARPGVVTGNWKAGYSGGTSTTIPIAGVLMEQLKSRYGQPHAAYKMTARKNIKPYAPVVWNGNTYTVEAYDRDLYDDTTTITID